MCFYQCSRLRYTVNHFKVIPGHFPLFPLVELQGSCNSNVDTTAHLTWPPISCVMKRLLLFLLFLFLTTSSGWILCGTIVLNSSSISALLWWTCSCLGWGHWSVFSYHEVFHFQLLWFGWATSWGSIKCIPFKLLTSRYEISFYTMVVKRIEHMEACATCVQEGIWSNHFVAIFSFYLTEVIVSILSVLLASVPAQVLLFVSSNPLVKAADDSSFSVIFSLFFIWT